MTDETSRRPELTPQAADAVEALAEFHLAHHRGASWLQRQIDRVTALMARPPALVAFASGLILWMVATALFTPHGVEQTSFGWLELAANCAGLLVAVLILVTQRREDQLAERRSQLTLHLAILADKKSAKIIALLEELRRDQPGVSDRHDPVSEEMATPTDVPRALAAIDEQASAAAALAQGGEAAGG
jgi:uncharacterized membrane protein